MRFGELLSFIFSIFQVESFVQDVGEIKLAERTQK